MADKATKEAANYRNGTPSKHCGLCSMYRPPDNCTAVEGDISPTDVCDYFRRAFSRHERWYGEKK